MNKSTKTIYLAGGIQDLSSKDQNEWREIATKELYPRFNILNPMRRNFRDSEFQSQNEIVQLDKADIVEADILLVNATKPSWGTAMEIIFANMRHKIVVCFTNKNYKNINEKNSISPWVSFHSTRMSKDLDEAIKYIEKHF